LVEPGRRCLGDRYELHQLIAAGGMGQIWRGTDVALHRPVAVKVLRSEYTGDPSFLDRFRAEAQHAASLSHPNIAAVFDYGEEIAQDGTGETMAYLVMELVEGEPLSALVAREGPLDTATTLSLLRQTAFGLGEAHRAGMVHRDVKPGNILVRPDGSVKITDFGIAWSARSVALTRTGQVIGTPQYLSPEQAEGRLATPASDVYALGLIGYECLTGHPAFEGDNAVTIALKQVQQDPEPLPEELPPDVRQLISRSLVKDPAGRLPDGAAFAAAVDDILAGRPLPEAPPTVAVPVPRSTVARPPAARRNRLAMVLLPVLGLLAGAGIAVALLLALANDAPASPATAAEQRQAGTLVLAAQDYIGRPVDDVAARLTGLGLQVQLKSEARDDVVPDQVTGIEPEGRALQVGDTVVVTYAVATGVTDGPDTAVVTGAAVGGSATTTTAPDDAATTVDDGTASPTTAAPAPTTATATTLPAAPTSTVAGGSTSTSTTASSSASQPSTSSSSSPATTSSSDADQ
jgi:eukaryotic-like serine/threonine-protein kinase